VLKTDKVLAKSGHLATDLGHEMVIFNTRNEKYYGLNDVGTRVWSLIQEPKTVGEIVKIVVAEYDVEPEQFERDLTNLLQDLQSANLIEIK
jgi:coenzyme PQQ synthesis protein D (PqqD)